MKKKHLVILIILLAGLASAYALIKTAPKPQKKSLAPSVPLVEVKAFSHVNNRPSWSGGSEVNANVSVNLVAQVVGQIEHIPNSIFPGAFVKKGSTLASIDDANYQLALKQKKAMVIQAQANLDIELAQVQNAKSDYKLSGIQLKKSAKSVALRDPQLASSKAALAIAKADLAKAQLDLNRTKLTMPFDGYIITQHVSQGAYVNNASAVFELIDSQSYRLEVKVPQKFIDILDKESAVTINKIDSNKTRTGKILSVLPQVNASDRQVRVLISIEDPLALHSTLVPIRYNDYVQVTLFGQEMQGAVQLNTDDLKDGNKIWIVDENTQLQQRFVDVLYSGRIKSWVRINLEDGDQLLNSPLVNAKPGMAVRFNHTNTAALADQEDAL